MKVLAMPPLAEPEGFLLKANVCLLGWPAHWFPFLVVRPSARANHRTSRDDNHSVTSISSPVPKDHACSTSMLKHFKPESVSSSAKSSLAFFVAHAMQAIIVHDKFVSNPQFAAIVGDDGEPVHTSSFDEQGTCPTNSKVVAASKATPTSAGAAIVHGVHMRNHVWTAAIEILATPALTKPECFLF
jgi:hypothetical protein